MQRLCMLEVIWDLLIPLLNDQKRFQRSLISPLPLFLKYPLRFGGRSQLCFIKIPVGFVKKYCSLLLLFHFSRRLMEMERKK